MHVFKRMFRDKIILHFIGHILKHVKNDLFLLQLSDEVSCPYHSDNSLIRVHPTLLVNILL